MKKIIIIILLFSIPIVTFSQKFYTISGYVTDKNTGEVLIGATIFEKTLFKSTITNEYGFYSFTLPEGHYSIQFSYLGYQSFDTKVMLNENITKKLNYQN